MKVTATIGTFDGVHRGHLLVLQKVKELAQETDTVPTVITFPCHPLEVLRPKEAPGRLTLPQEEVERLKKEGMNVIVEDFDSQIAASTAEDWLRRMKELHNVECLVMGYDNVFGCDGTRMDISDYIELGKKLNVRVEKAPMLKDVSSSGIRRLIAAGDVAKAKEKLGRPYRVTGIVGKGKGLGHAELVPTANISVESPQLLPASGVYKVEVTLPDGNVRPGVTAIGTCPTIGSASPVSVETHIIGFDGDLYGEKISIDFLKYLRPEQKFDSLEELKARIEEDIRMAK